MEGAPDPSLGHDGSFGDARCLLEHMEEPCDYVDKKGKKWLQMIQQRIGPPK